VGPGVVVLVGLVPVVVAVEIELGVGPVADLIERPALLAGAAGDS